MKSGITPLQGDVQQILNKVVASIVAQFHPKKIIFFGSHARGLSSSDSDLDLLIVMDVKGTTRQQANEIDRAMIARRIPMDFLVLTPEQYEQQRKIIGTVARQAEREGKVVYEHAA